MRGSRTIAKPVIERQRIAREGKARAKAQISLIDIAGLDVVVNPFKTFAVGLTIPLGRYITERSITSLHESEFGILWRIMNTQIRYGVVAMTLHWLVVAFVSANLVLGFYFTLFMGLQSPQFTKIVEVHESIGLIVLLLGVLQFGWRLISPIPPLPDCVERPYRAIAYATHYLLYALIIAIPLAGWALVSSSNHGPISFFGVFGWPNLPSSQPGSQVLGVTLEWIHGLLACSLVLLVLLHISAALWHHFSRRDDVLKRMIPGTSPGQAS